MLGTSGLVCHGSRRVQGINAPMTGNGLKLSHSYGNMIWAPEQPNPVHPSMAIHITHVLIMDCASKTHCENDPEVNSTTSESQGQGCCLIATIEIDLHLKIRNKKLLGQYYGSIYTTWPRQLSAEIGLPCCPGMQQHCSSLSDLLMNWAMNAIPLYQCTWIPWQQKEFACFAIPGDCDNPSSLRNLEQCEEARAEAKAKAEAEAEVEGDKDVEVKLPKTLSHFRAQPRAAPSCNRTADERRNPEETLIMGRGSQPPYSLAFRHSRGLGSTCRIPFSFQYLGRERVKNGSSPPPSCDHDPRRQVYLKVDHSYARRSTVAASPSEFLKWTPYILDRHLCQADRARRIWDRALGHAKVIVSPAKPEKGTADTNTSRDRVHPGCGHVVKLIPVPTMNTARPQHICQTFPRRSGNVAKALRLLSSAIQG
ncbi:uncharacterized protein NECHADRAFT_80760 [Fusarium vanettenii 77-13-4]|uniref:Uncharacterized protein n=1 Tax=Fusarium vanettenii (strain ATCC MYA-4622 / CBS 123669 / FGSC 9596 / NRRL 45880 / 77-13-4) TaxID=660122 RepID=C7YSJ8_FUSV7|nr:uncharacterized protein NECHADRAFT_80760 [Fusarium vanettenii 77-13-4]EEU45651.1 predicted protein [Fusarium vanettenii 77-13-4]